MQCKKLLSNTFLTDNLNKSWVQKEYKEYRSKLLADDAISKLSEVMDLAVKYKDWLEADTEHKKLMDTLAVLEEKTRQQRIKCNYAYDRQMRLKDRYDNETEHDCLDDDTIKESKKYIMPCPASDCRGYLSRQYECGLCHLFTCKQCHAIIGPTKDTWHECIEEQRLSTQLIQKETKPCPSCGTRIFKISGCDQMWCPGSEGVDGTICNTAFSYSTGLKSTGPVHNPHFYEYARLINVVQPDTQDAQHPCPEAIIAVHTFVDRLHILIPHPHNKLLREKLLAYHRLAVHIHAVEIDGIHKKLEKCNNKHPRVLFVLQKINKEELTKILYSNDVTQQKLKLILNVFELFGVVLKEKLRKIANAVKELPWYTLDEKDRALQCTAELEELEVLRGYCNEQFKSISLAVNQAVPHLTDKLVVKRIKFIRNARASLPRVQEEVFLV
jgi:hypothetical protein